MQMVRTTLSLPGDLHEELRLQAFKQKTSLNKLIVEKISDKKKVKDNTFLLTKMAKKLGKSRVNWAKEIRKERNKRSKHLTEFL